MSSVPLKFWWKIIFVSIIYFACIILIIIIYALAKISFINIPKSFIFEFSENRAHVPVHCVDCDTEKWSWNKSYTRSFVKRPVRLIRFIHLHGTITIILTDPFLPHSCKKSDDYKKKKKPLKLIYIYIYITSAANRATLYTVQSISERTSCVTFL